jgi:hypothetical protein
MALLTRYADPPQIYWKFKFASQCKTYSYTDIRPFRTFPQPF